MAAALAPAWLLHQLPISTTMPVQPPINARRQGGSKRRHADRRSVQSSGALPASLAKVGAFWSELHFRAPAAAAGTGVIYFKLQPLRRATPDPKAAEDVPITPPAQRSGFATKFRDQI